MGKISRTHKKKDQLPSQSFLYTYKNIMLYIYSEQDFMFIANKISCRVMATRCHVGDI